VRMPRELHEVGVLQLAVPAEVVDDLHLPHGPRWRRPAPLRVRLLHPAAAHPPPFRLHSPPLYAELTVDAGHSQLATSFRLGSARRAGSTLRGGMEGFAFGEKEAKEWSGNGTSAESSPSHVQYLYYTVVAGHLAQAHCADAWNMETEEKEAFCPGRCVIDRAWRTTAAHSWRPIRGARTAGR
jgi:hypothetical protein